MKNSKISQVAGAVALALTLSTGAYAADTNTNATNETPAMTGKQNATAIGATRSSSSPRSAAPPSARRSCATSPIRSRR